jgi:hypothetical protein
VKAVRDCRGPYELNEYGERLWPAGAKACERVVARVSGASLWCWRLFRGPGKRCAKHSRGKA